MGTNAMAAPMLGLIECLIAIMLAGIYFKWEIRQVEKNHEGFLPTGAEISKVQLTVADADFKEINIVTCLIPSIVLIVTLNVLKQPVYIAATFGIIVGYIIYWKRLINKIETFKRDAMQSINELTQARLPHSVGYRPMGVCSVLIPIVVALCLSVIAQFGIV